jgi:glycosyltransferase involved in cell wall biosynthesis
MKILFFLSSHKIGLSNLLAEQAIFLNQLKDIDFYFVAGENEQETGLGELIKKHLITCKRIHGIDEHDHFWQLVKEFSAYMDEISPDIVHVQTNWQLVIATIAKFFVYKKYKIFYTIHGFRNNQKYKAKIALHIIQLLLFLFADRIFAASTVVYEKFIFVKRKISLLYLGVEEKFFTIKTPIAPSVNGVRMIFAGQFREGKNQLSLIPIINEYIKLTDDHSIKLILPGNGPLREVCIKLTEQYNLEKYIEFPGQISRQELIELYKTCNIAIIPSASETFGHAIAEPFVLGMCVISRKVGIAIDIIQQANNGYIYETDNELLKILYELNQNKTKIQTCGINAFSQRNEFRWTNIAEKYSKILHAKGC